MSRLTPEYARLLARELTREEVCMDLAKARTHAGGAKMFSELTGVPRTYLFDIPARRAPITDQLLDRLYGPAPANRLLPEWTGAKPEDPMTGEELRLAERGVSKPQVLEDLAKVVAHCGGIQGAADGLDLAPGLIEGVLDHTHVVGKAMLLALYGPKGCSLPEPWREWPEGQGPEATPETSLAALVAGDELEPIEEIPDPAGSEGEQPQGDAPAAPEPASQAQAMDSGGACMQATGCTGEPQADTDPRRAPRLEPEGESVPPPVVAPVGEDPAAPLSSPIEIVLSVPVLNSIQALHLDFARRRRELAEERDRLVGDLDRRIARIEAAEAALQTVHRTAVLEEIGA